MRTIKQTSLLWSFRCYRALLRLYPSRFRDEFGALQCQAFGDLARRAIQAHGFLGLVALWTRTLPDLFSSAVNQWFGSSSHLSLQVRWILACALGWPLGGLFVLFCLGALQLGRLATRLLFARQEFHSGIGGAVPVPVHGHAGEIFLATVLLLAIVSFPLGWLQSRVFDGGRSWRFGWALATVLGVAAGWQAMATFLSGNYLWTTIVAYRDFVRPTGYLLFGSIFGLFQAAPMVFKTSRAWAWVPATGIGMLAVAYLGDLAAPVGTLTTVLAASLAGALFGVITAIPMTWIIQPVDSMAKRPDTTIP